MERYKNLGRFEGKPSSIIGYELGDGCIDVVFARYKNGNHKKYSYRSERVGANNMEIMHKLAQAGKGLNAFINTTKEVKTNSDGPEDYYPDWE